MAINENSFANILKASSTSVGGMRATGHIHFVCQRCLLLLATAWPSLACWPTLISDRQQGLIIDYSLETSIYTDPGKRKLSNVLKYCGENHYLSTY